MKSRAYFAAVCLGTTLSAQGCGQLLGYNEDKPTVMEAGGGNGGTGAGGAGVCSDATQCPGSDTLCQTRTCIGGVCGFDYAMMGMAAGDPTLGDCQQNVCNGNGGTMSAADDTDTPSDATVCTTDTCINGIPTFTPVASGTACSEGNGTVCDETGACKLADGAVCAAGAECVSSNCVDGVCCDNACMGTCKSCGVVGSVGTCSNIPVGQDDTNATMTCSGATQSCDGAGVCKKENAQACAAGGDCLSGVCAGSVCSAQSCIDLPATCGPQNQNNENCCVSSVVTGGTYNRSNDAAYPATVSDFRLDRFEITVGRFRQFVEAYPGNKPLAGAGAHPLMAGSGWNAAWNPNLPTGQAALKAAVNCGNYPTWTDMEGANEKLPMNCLNWYESFAFCAWDGGRLPTEAEWNYAAAGGNEQRQCPWGACAVDATSYGVYSCLGDGMSGCVFADILTVGSKSPTGDGRWGQADLGGSMWEWNLDWYQTPYAPSCNDCANLIQNQSTSRAIRGGDWTDGSNKMSSSIRSGITPSDRYSTTGARCARTP